MKKTEAIINYNEIKFETDRLVIRRIKKADWQDFYEIMGNELTMIFLGRANTLEEVKGYVENQSNQEYHDFSGNYAIVLKEENKVIGQFGLEINSKHSKASISYLFNSKYWNKGYAIECAKYMVDYAFNEIKLNRIEADCVKENESSLKIFKKLNMNFEGKFKEARYNKRLNKFFDVVYYAILRSEYK